MAVAESAIEDRIRAYIADTLAKNELPTRHNSIRTVTGDLDVLPSAVAKVLTRMIEAGALKHVTNDVLRLVDQPAPKPAEPTAPAAAPAPAAGKGKAKR